MVKSLPKAGVLVLERDGAGIGGGPIAFGVLRFGGRAGVEERKGARET